MHFQRFDSEWSGIRSESRPAVVPALGSFVMCPLAIAPTGGWIPELYRIALERAQEAVQRPWHERYLAPAMN
jgi:hypothetical protein